MQRKKTQRVEDISENLQPPEKRQKVEYEYVGGGLTGQNYLTELFPDLQQYDLENQTTFSNETGSYETGMTPSSDFTFTESQSTLPTQNPSSAQINYADIAMKVQRIQEWKQQGALRNMTQEQEPQPVTSQRLQPSYSQNYSQNFQPSYSQSPVTYSQNSQPFLPNSQYSQQQFSQNFQPSYYQGTSQYYYNQQYPQQYFSQEQPYFPQQYVAQHQQQTLPQQHQIRQQQQPFPQTQQFPQQQQPIPQQQKNKPVSQAQKKGLQPKDISRQQSDLLDQTQSLTKEQQELSTKMAKYLKFLWTTKKTIIALTDINTILENKESDLFPKFKDYSALNAECEKHKLVFDYIDAEQSYGVFLKNEDKSICLFSKNKQIEKKPKPVQVSQVGTFSIPNLPNFEKNTSKNANTNSPRGHKN